MKKWFKAHKLISFLIIAIIVAVIFLSTAAAADENGPLAGMSGTVFGKIGKPFVAIGRKVKQTVTGAFLYDDALEEIEQLKDKINELESQQLNDSMSKSELQELRKMKSALNYVGGDSKKLVTCDITAMSGTNWMGTFTINAGKNHGIKEGSVVVYGSGLVGKITSVGPDWAKVSTVMDSNVNVSFTVRGKSRIMGILDGSDGSSFSGYTIDADAAIAEGDVLVTSGMGLYPKNILVGTVSKVVYDREKQMKTITVKPYVTYNTIRKVSVII